MTPSPAHRITQENPVNGGAAAAGLDEIGMAGVDPAGLLLALLATGPDIERGLADTLRMIADGLDPAVWVAARPSLAAQIAPMLTPLTDRESGMIQPLGYGRRVPVLLDRVAEIDPDLAQATLMVWGKGLKTEGSLDLSNRTWVTAVPEDMSIGWWLMLDGCRNLKSVGGNLRVEKSLCLRGCEALEKLPDGVSVGMCMFLDGCVSLTSIGKRTVVQNVHPTGVRGDIYTRDCKKLETVPEDLETAHFHLERASSLGREREYSLRSMAPKVKSWER